MAGESPEAAASTPIPRCYCTAAAAAAAVRSIAIRGAKTGLLACGCSFDWLLAQQRGALDTSKKAFLFALQST